MKVKLATQILSRTVAAGMSTLIEYGELSKKAKCTIEFLININDLFDLLNSSTLTSFSHKRPITTANWCQKRAQIILCSQWIRSWSFQHKVNLKSICSLPFKSGLLVTLENMERIIDTCFANGFSFVCTRHFNQDVVEVSVKI